MISCSYRDFVLLAKEITPFLTKYQDDMSLLPFLARGLLRSLVAWFIELEVLCAADTARKLLRIQVLQQCNHVGNSQVDIIFAADQLLQQLKCKKLVSDRQSRSAWMQNSALWR